MLVTSHAQDNTCSSSTAEGQISRSRPYVDHTYHDFSRYLQEGGQITKHKKAGANFPAKLHRMLSDPQFSHIIAWMPHGRVFKIMNKKLLMAEAVPTYFVQTKFESFTRQLSGWGFKRLHQPGADFGCYYHECFLRGLPQLTWLMARVSSKKQGKPSPFAEGEPDFYLISRSHPLPTPAITLGHEDCTNPMSARQAEAASVVTPALQSVPYLQTCDWSNGTQNTMMPLAKEDCSESSAAVAASRLPSMAMHHIHRHFSNVAQNSTASSAAVVTNIPPSSSGIVNASLTTSTSTAVSTQMNDLTSYQIQMLNATNAQSPPRNFQALMPPTQISSMMSSSSAFMNCQPPYQQLKKVLNSSHRAGPPANFNLNDSAYYSSYPTKYAPTSDAMPDNSPQYYSASTSAAVPYTSPQYYGDGLNSRSTQGRLHPSHHQQESNTSSVSWQQGNDDHAQEAHRGEGDSQCGSFADEFGLFIDNFTF